MVLEVEEINEEDGLLAQTAAGTEGEGRDAEIGEELEHRGG